METLRVGIKEALFAQAIVAGKTKTEAALSVGIGKSSAAAQGSRMSKRGSVSRLISELRARKEAPRFDKADVLSTLESLAIAGSQVYEEKSKSGKKHPALVEGNTAAKACELLGKHLGMWDAQPEGATINVNLYFPERLTQAQELEMYGEVIDVAPSEAVKQIEGSSEEAKG